MLKLNIVGSSSFIYREILSSRLVLASVLLFSAGVNLLYLASPIYMMQIYDRVLTSGSFQTLLFLSVALVVALFTLWTLESIRLRLLVRISERLDERISPGLLERGFAPDGVSTRGMSPFRDLDALKAAVAGPASTALFDAPWNVAYVLICFLIHPFIGAAAVVGTVLLIAVGIINRNYQFSRLRESNKRSALFFSQLQSDRSSLETTRSLGMSGPLVRRLVEVRHASNAAHTEVSLAEADYSALSKFLRLFMQSAVLAIGASLAITQEIGSGTIIAASIIVSRALGPIEQLVSHWRYLENGMSAITILDNVLNSKGDPTNFLKLPVPVLGAELEKISVRSRRATILRDVSLQVLAGQIVLVHGANGAGKTTLAKVVANAIQPDAGVARLDGADYKFWIADELGRHIGYLPSEISLLAGTIAQNISRFDLLQARESQAEANVVLAAKAVGVHEHILKLPDGYDTVIGSSSAGLSLGLAQRVALARAFYGNPLLFVLDEPDAHLDQLGQAALVQALKAARERKAAVFLVAHGQSLNHLADKNLVIENGQVREVYTPKQGATSKILNGGNLLSRGHQVVLK